MYECIEKWADEICDELSSAMSYTEEYLGYHDKKYHEMAEDELKHAGYLMEFAAEDLDDLNTEQKAVWEYEKQRFAKKRQKIKNMLTM